MSTGKSIDSEIAQRIREAMAHRGLSVRELSNLAKVPYPSLQSYLSAKHDIPSPVLSRIAQALGVSCDWLLLEEPASIDPKLFAEILPIMYDVRRLSKNNLDFESVANLLLNMYRREFWRMMTGKIPVSASARMPIAWSGNPPEKDD